jgi:hypothetical protein
VRPPAAGAAGGPARGRYIRGTPKEGHDMRFGEHGLARTGGTLKAGKALKRMQPRCALARGSTRFQLVHRRAHASPHLLRTCEP